MRKALPILAVLFALGVSHTTARGLNDRDEYILAWNGPPENLGESRVQVTEVVSRSPLFANVPFLRLRTGDQLVTGKLWMEDKGGANWCDYPAEYLKCGERFATIQENGGEPHDLSSAADCLLFDWDEVTVEKAEAVRRLVRRDGELTVSKFEILAGQIRKAMPELSVEITSPIHIAPPKLVVFGQNTHVVFEGIAFGMPTPWRRLGGECQ